MRVYTNLIKSVTLLEIERYQLATLSQVSKNNLNGYI